MKYFIVSDVHGFLNELMNALKQKGFDAENKDHKLIVCGDLFDRGSQAVELFEFVKGLGDRFVYVRGNHEDLLFDCYRELQGSFGCGYHHVSNGTVDTIGQFTGLSYYNLMVNTPERNKALKEKLEPLLDFITNKTVDYYEVGDYIFVHGWIPSFLHLNDFRDGNEDDWKAARWNNGMDMWRNPANRIDGKTIVCGHWHCSWGWSHIRQERKEWPQKNRKNWLESFEPFADDGIIAIDACTAYTKNVTVLVIEA
jgi:serine/threonine protein phosphatase 1